MRTRALECEQWQHFRAELREQFWGDLYGRTQLAWKRILETVSEQDRDRTVEGRTVGAGRGPTRARNGFYERTVVTRFCTLRLRIARTRTAGFLPARLARFNGGPRSGPADWEVFFRQLLAFTIVRARAKRPEKA